MDYGSVASAHDGSFLASVGSYSSNMSMSRRQSKALRKSMNEAQEAEVLSQATSQAITAARSMLLAGGSETTALSTAKAAAASILIPFATDAESGRGFLGRRKAKRQAEIVASMALVSVKNSLLQSSGSDLNRQHGDRTPFVVQTGNEPFMSEAPVQATASIDSSRNSQYLTKIRVRGNDQRPPDRPNNGGHALPRPPLSPRKSAAQKMKESQVEQAPLPQKMPMPRSRTKNLAAAFPDEDPIYYASVGNTTSVGAGTTRHSYSSEGDSFTQDSSAYMTYAQQTDDGILAALTKAFTCGYEPSEKAGRSEEEFDDEEEDEEETIHERREPPEQREFKAKVIPVESGSSADSAEVLRELNVSSSDDPKALLGVRESMEEVVLRALSNSSQKPETVDRIAKSRASEDELSGLRENTLSVRSSAADVGTPKENGLSRRSRFKKWVLLRKQRANTE